MKFFLTFLCSLVCLLYVEARTLTFAPLPMNDTQKVLEEFSAMVNYLETQLNENIDFVYEKKYDDIINAFKENKIDLAYFGPLPLITLRQSQANALPLVTFNESNGKSWYRCALVKFANDHLIFKEANKTKLALTQPLSTCGYMQTKNLLKSYANIDIELMKFNYLGNHDNVALSIIRGDFAIGGMKESIAQEYASLGLQILYTSQVLPGFTLVANRSTLNEQQMEKIKQILLDAPPEIYKKWGKNISYGVSTVNLQQFELLKIDTSSYQIPQKGNF